MESMEGNIDRVYEREDLRCSRQAHWHISAAVALVLGLSVEEICTQNLSPEPLDCSPDLHTRQVMNERFSGQLLNFSTSSLL
jgi:hypothetical protein